MNVLLPVLLCALLVLSAPGQPAPDTTAELLRAPTKGQRAVLTGRFTGKKNFTTYRFRDAAGDILVDVEDVPITRDMKQGALVRIEGTLMKPFGAREWEISLNDAIVLDRKPMPSKSDLPPDPGSAAGTKSPAGPPTARKPYRPPTEVTPKARVGSVSIAQLLKAPGRDPVIVSGTILEVVSTRKILLWDGQAALAVRLDQLPLIPELARAQRVQVTGVPVREGEALVELQARSIR